MRVGIIGEGGREEALLDAVLKSPLVSDATMFSGKSFGEILQRTLARQLSFLVVGPEQPLADGVVDFFKSRAPSISIFGPNRLAAKLESSKIYMKTRCVRWGIPTADFDFAGSYKVAERIIKEKGFRIVKADGLCGGKGVKVTNTEEEALAAVREMLIDRIHGRAGSRLVLEERLYGVECSIMALCDGMQARRLAPARDEKRLQAGSEIMTGGVGAYSPLPDLNNAIMEEIQVNILDVLIAGMARERRPYNGLLYAGIMLTKGGPKLLEVNCRFGDPEAQVVLPRLKTDIVPYLTACCKKGGLSALPPLEWSESAAVCVVLFSPEYPASGHRLKSIVALGDTIAGARTAVYAHLRDKRVNALYRKDIAAGV